MMSPHIRWMIRRDMPEVLRIESDSFASPWTEDDYIQCLRQRNCIGMVAEKDDEIVGFMLYELHKDMLHVLRFTVCIWHRFSGVGTAMVDKLKSKLSSDRRTRLLIEVSDDNLDAHLFLKRMGMTATDVIRDAYVDTTSDAYRFQLTYRELASKAMEAEK